MGDEIVIIGDDGTEHVFPAGMDPKKAAAIVRGQASEQPNAGGSAVAMDALAGGDLARGFMKRAMESVSAGGDLLRKIPGVVKLDALVPPVAVDTTRRTPMEQAGAAAELAAELYGPGKLAVSVARKAPGVIAKGLGISKARAGANMGAALEAAKDVTVPLSEATQAAALRSRDLAGTGNKVVNQLLDRLTNPKVTQYRGGDLLAKETQDFITKLGDLSAKDAQGTSKAAMRELVRLTQGMRSDLTTALGPAGTADQYARGVAEYARAAKAGKAAKWVAGASGVTGAAAAGIGWLRRALQDAVAGR